MDTEVWQPDTRSPKPFYLTVDAGSTGGADALLLTTVQQYVDRSCGRTCHTRTKMHIQILPFVLRISGVDRIAEIPLL